MWNPGVEHDYELEVRGGDLVHESSLLVADRLAIGERLREQALDSRVSERRLHNPGLVCSAHEEVQRLEHKRHSLRQRKGQRLGRSNGENARRAFDRSETRPCGGRSRGREGQLRRVTTTLPSLMRHYEQQMPGQPLNALINHKSRVIKMKRRLR